MPRRQHPNAMRQEREGEDTGPAWAGVRQVGEAPASGAKCKGMLRNSAIKTNNILCNIFNQTNAKNP